MARRPRSAAGRVSLPGAGSAGANSLSQAGEAGEHGASSLTRLSMEHLFRLRDAGRSDKARQLQDLDALMAAVAEAREAVQLCQPAGDDHVLPLKRLVLDTVRGLGRLHCARHSL